ncbi:xanthine/uracil/thiamine/ascorbate permease family protein [Candidatus Sulfotelmatomonas gaucii]|uniref:Xanthine/uracil/thiamine/ascorbate permease family protein n=1 Tax=Candidatus Sulfuritelmatomonas gaucii TaxID=2043161 RepID=A0A2N9LCM2_9BACT|nr:xanthine/uracil/thiamine/ascorbate permease family protein [Candidatus Sulfotelmatomonas gaucii]
MLKKLEAYFEFARLGTNWRTEILAGATTFVTMAYIVLVNPAILADAGVPEQAVTAATCISAAFGSILMGIVARYPIALAPGMGLNAYFTYTVCLKMHVPWQTALGAVFLSGVIFLAITALGIRQMILRAIPHQLYAAVAGGIGLFIAFIGFQHAGLVVGDPHTLVSMGSVRNPTAYLALLGLILMVALEIRKVKGSILIGVLAVTGIAWAMHLVHWTPSAGGIHALAATAFKLDIRGAVNTGLLEIIFVFFFVDLFDNLGTLVAVTKRAGLIQSDHSIPRLNRILFADATATVFGSFTGTSTVTSYVESTAGVAAGGRSGVTAIVTGLLFLCAIVAAPFIGIVPPAATAPALILVGCLMLAAINEIQWNDPLVAVPAFLTLVLIPLTYSIANGLGFGIIAWAVLHLLAPRVRRQDWLLYLIAALFLARFIYLGTN